MKSVAVVLLLALLPVPPLAAKPESAAIFRPHRLADDGAWCWFGNPRALFKDGVLYFGYVRAGDGRVCLNAFDPARCDSTVLWTSTWTQRDDHDNPSLLALADGRLLGIYQTHGSRPAFWYRLSRNTRPVTAADWGAERVFTNTVENICYANPHQLRDETNRVFNFMRNLKFNPTFVTADESVSGWSAPRILIESSGQRRRARPYVQYCSDGRKRIDFIYTDGHPNEEANSLYHAYYQDGAIHRSDGTVLKALADAPLRHDPPHNERGTVIYPYSDAPAADPDEHIPGIRAWCWDLAQDRNGAPVCVFSGQKNKLMGTNWFDARLFYYYARWDGTQWRKHFIAHAGRPLYDEANNYAGGITLDPRDPGVVYLSSNAAEPFDVRDTARVALSPGGRYEIYRGVTKNGGRAFRWRALTARSEVDNLRPYVPRNNPYACGVVWYAGTYTTYKDWDTAFLGVFAGRPPEKIAVTRAMIGRDPDGPGGVVR